MLEEGDKPIWLIVEENFGVVRLSVDVASLALPYAVVLVPDVTIVVISSQGQTYLVTISVSVTKTSSQPDQANA